MADRITLRDVAREAGVHTSTASRALNVHTRSVVNPETVERVLRASKRLGYTPNPLARGLRTNQTMTAGMIIPDIENPLFGPIIAGVEEALGEEGYSLLITDADRGDTSAVSSSIETLVDRRVDGLVLATATRSGRVVSDVLRRDIPVVLVNRSSEGLAIPSVTGDDRAGIGLVVEHLVSLGHERIGHISGPRDLSTGLGRYEAFLSWMERLGMGIASDAIEEANRFQVQPGYDAATALLARRPDLTAIVAGNDLLALGAYRAVREQGLEVGSDVSITGYNDIPLLDLMHPPLTSVRVPYREMGSVAATILLSMIGEGNSHGTRQQSVQLVPTLSIRGSTQPVPS